MSENKYEQLADLAKKYSLGCLVELENDSEINATAAYELILGIQVGAHIYHLTKSGADRETAIEEVIANIRKIINFTNSEK